MTFHQLEAPNYDGPTKHEDNAVNIKAVADISQLPAKTIRYYEDIGLIMPSRARNGYRRYSTRDAHKLIFIGRARTLGFTIQDCRIVLSLYEDKSYASADVKRVAQEYVGRIEEKIGELKSVRRTLRDLVDTCHGAHRPDYPILVDLAGGQEREHLTI